MATTYNIKIEADNGETMTEVVNSGVRDTVAQLSSDPLFDLGEKVTTNRVTEGDTTFTTYSHERGKVYVTTRRNQYTDAQRQGRRRF